MNPKKVNKADPRVVPPGDVQGHTYQHELGDPRKSQQIESHLKKVTRETARERKSGPPKTARGRSNAKSPGRPVVWVTGSSGLIGSKVVAALSANYAVVGMDLAPPKNVPAGADFVACDLTKDTSVKKAVNTIRERHGDKVASIIHLAAYYDFSGEPSPMYKRLTVDGTRRLLEGLQALTVEQFIFSSTILVMEPSEDEPIEESSPLEDEPWDYPRSKIETERLLLREHKQIPAVILRIGGVYDKYVRTVPVAQQIARIYRKELESHFFPGDAGHGQAFVHIDDLVDCFLRVIERRAQLDPMEIFLIAEPDLMSYRDLQIEIGKLIHGEQWTTVWMPKLLAKAGAWVKGRLSGDEKTFIKPWMIDLADDHYPVTISHARQKLGWEPQHSLRRTLPEMIANLKANPKRWFQINKIETAPADEKRSA